MKLKTKLMLAASVPGLVILGIIIGAGLSGGGLGILSWWGLTNAGLGSGLATIIVIIVLAPPLLLAVIAISMQFTQGFLWAIIRTFEGWSIQWSNITHPWQRPWRKPMMRFVLLYAVVSIALATGMFLISFSVTLKGTPSFASRSIGAAMAIGLQMTGQILDGLLLLATLLIGPIILNHPRPRLMAAISDYRRILRNQLGRIAAVVGLTVAVGLVLDLPVQLLQATSGGSPFTGCLGLPFVIIGALFNLYFLFLVAAVFRAIYGLPMGPGYEPNLSPYVDPLLLNVRPFRPHPRAPLDFDPGAFLPPQPESDNKAPPGEIGP